MEVFQTVVMSVLSAFTSQNICAGENERTVSIVKYGIVMTVVFGIMCCILWQFVYEPMASFFFTDTAVSHSAGWFYLFTDYLRMLFVVDNRKQKI